MDLLGKKGEEASEEVQTVFQQVEDLKSHLNALDNAVQHHDQEIDQVVEALTSEQKVPKYIEENAEDVKALKKVFRKFAAIQSQYIERVDVLDSELNSTDKDVASLESKISRLKKGQNALFDELEDLKQKIDEIESEFILDTNRQEWDIDSKVDESTFESHEQKVEEELSKLRTSLNDLSEKVDEEEIQIE